MQRESVSKLRAQLLQEIREEILLEVDSRCQHLEKKVTAQIKELARTCNAIGRDSQQLRSAVTAMETYVAQGWSAILQDDAASPFMDLDSIQEDMIVIPEEKKEKKPKSRKAHSARDHRDAERESRRDERRGSVPGRSQFEAAYVESPTRRKRLSKRNTTHFDVLDTSLPDGISANALPKAADDLESGAEDNFRDSMLGTSRKIDMDALLEMNVDAREVLRGVIPSTREISSASSSPSRASPAAMKATRQSGLGDSSDEDPAPDNSKPSSDSLQAIRDRLRSVQQRLHTNVATPAAVEKRAQAERPPPADPAPVPAPEGGSNAA